MLMSPIYFTPTVYFRRHKRFLSCDIYNAMDILLILGGVTVVGVILRIDTAVISKGVCYKIREEKVPICFGKKTFIDTMLHASKDRFLGYGKHGIFPRTPLLSLFKETRNDVCGLQAKGV